LLNLLLACAAVAAQTDTMPVILAGAPASAAAPVLRAAAPKAKLVVADSLVLDKSDRRLTLFYRGEMVRKYAVALGKNPIGDKLRRGDGRTPEGLFFINGRNPNSKYHRALRISYPDVAHSAKAAKRGVSPGGDIMIHGLPKAFATVGALHRQQDWTEGCVAVTNQEIEEIWRAVPNGARILIQP
jgi:murein L,D-transpeptidase YafK